MSDATYFKLDSGGKSVSAAHPLPVTAGVEMGALDDAAWDGATGDPASLIALWKGMMAQLVEFNAP